MTCFEGYQETRKNDRKGIVSGSTKKHTIAADWYAFLYG